MEALSQRLMQRIGSQASKGGSSPDKSDLKKSTLNPKQIGVPKLPSFNPEEPFESSIQKDMQTSEESRGRIMDLNVGQRSDIITSQERAYQPIPSNKDDYRTNQRQ